MKVMKKISALLLSLSLIISCLSIVAYAADGRVSFSDPQTSVGEMVDVKMAVRSTSGNFGNIEVKVSYDASYLRFQSGDGVTQDGDGALTCTASGGSKEQIFMMKFQALQEGKTSVSVSSMNVMDANNAAYTLEQGSSAVTIGPGDPSKIQEGPGTANMPSADDMQVEVNGQTFTLTDKFSDVDIPTGYQRTQVNLDGMDRQMVMNESSGVTLGYLLNGDAGDFYVFNSENATFSPYAEISISDTASIVLISDTSEVSLPEQYREATLTLSEKEFPVWQSSEDDGFYVIYAINGEGEKEYYRYDPKENTYQRFEVLDDGESATEDTPNSLLGKIQKFITDNVQKIMLISAAVLLVIFLMIIILGTKLRNRNLELDELYDQYGIDEEEPVKEKKEKKEKKAKKEKKNKKNSRKNEEPEDDFEDDFEEDFEDDFEDEFSTSDIGFETSDIEFETSDMGFETSDIEFETSDMGFETSDIEFETSDMGFETSDIEFETSDIEFETSDMGFETSDIEFETSDMGFETSDIEFETSDMGFETSEMDVEPELDLDSVESDDLVVYGGVSRKEELTIDDLDDLLNENRKEEKASKKDDFVMDFIDLD